MHRPMKPTTTIAQYMLVALLAIGTVTFTSAEFGPSGTVCHSFQLCHNSAGLAYTSVDLFAALEPLFTDLGLGAVNEYVDVSPMQSSAAGCSCTTPVNVHLTIPVPMGETASSISRQVLLFLEKELPVALSHVACQGEVQPVPCSQKDIAVARRRLSEMAIELAPEPVPAVSTASDSGDTSGSYGGDYGGDYSAYGGYEGGYGGYGGYEAEPALELGLPVARNLMAQPAAATDNKPSFIKAAVAAVTSSRCPPCPTCATTTPEKAVASASDAGAACYCRFNELSGSWALHEPACRAALFRKCSPRPGSLMDCRQLEAHYATYGAASADEAPYTANINAFLFVDCPPAAPCSCSGLRLDGRDSSSSAHAQCCSDLRAHCQVPFSGLSCQEVELVCTGATVTSAAVSMYVKVKNHQGKCDTGVTHRAYHAVTGATVTSAEAAAALLEGAPEQYATSPLNMVLLTVIAGSVAVAAAVAGVVALCQHYSYQQYAAPLISNGY